MFHESDADLWSISRGASSGAISRRRTKVFSLLTCPPVPPCQFDLVARASDGSGKILFSGRTNHAAPTLNLASIRRRGARLGANEVHVWSG